MRVVIGVVLLASLTACPGREDPLPPEPWRLEALAGDGVTAPAGDELDVAVRVLDDGDRPLAGAPVTFEVFQGGGTVDAAAPVPSGTDGVARARWRLGAGLGSNLLSARTAGNLQVLLSARGEAGPVARLEKVGDRQFAAAGSTIVVAFRMFDRLGHRTRSTPASCTVDAGGGSASPIAPADPAWDGACAWATGATPRVENRLTVSAGAAAPATFTAFTGVPSALTVRTSDLLHGSRTAVSLSPFGIAWAIVVDSAFEVASVTAHVEGLATPLAKGVGVPDAQAWVGATPGDTLPRGTVVARVTAVDVRGNEGDLYLWFELDRLPALAIASPIDLSLARSEVAVAASCGDDDPAGCTSLTATLGAGTAQALSGTSTIAGTFSLAGLPPGPVAIGFTAQDSAGHLVTATRTVWLEPSQHLALVGAAPGEVLDATTTEAFFQAPGEIGLVELATGVATTSPFGRPVRNGYLWPGGAAFVPENAVAEAWAWARGADPASIGSMQDGSSLQVAGGFGLVTRVGQGPGEQQLVRIDLASGTAINVDTIFSTFGSFQSDLAANGDVVFVAGAAPDLWRWRDGAVPLLSLTQDGQARGRPRTDGARVIYRKEVGPGDVRAAIWDGADQLLDADGCLAEPCLAIAGDWAAFFHPGPSGLGQLWRSGPGGLEQVTFFGQGSTLEALSPDGAVVFVNGTTRYRSAPGALDPTPVGAANGRVVVRDGKALVLLGRSVLEIVP